MSQTVNVPTCESNLGRTVSDFMNVEANKTKALSKRLYQGKLNAALKEAEKELDVDLLKLLQDQGVEVTGIKNYHSSHLLSKSLSIAKFGAHANGLTFIIFEFKDKPPLFFFSVCSLKDNFSRLEGRLYTKRRAVRALIEKGLAGLYSYPTREGFEMSVNPTKVGNWIVKNHILPEVEKEPAYINPLKYQNEDNLLVLAKGTLAHKYNLDLDSIRLHTQYIRFYRNSLFTQGLVCTPEWFKDLDQEGKELISNGGYTIYAMIGDNKETKKKEVIVTVAICSKEDAFVKSFGRKQCLNNFIQGNVKEYSLSQPLESVNQALVALAEQYFEHAINVKIEPEKVNSLLPKI